MRHRELLKAGVLAVREAGSEGCWEEGGSPFILSMGSPFHHHLKGTWA